jgi:DNA (cytosine-5)-methyltransferase 1
VIAVDLFAGAGGCSTGLLQAATARGVRVDLTAVNHWPRAVETHTVNHPEAQHFCASIETLDPRVAVPGGKLDLLIAAPECTHHSTARGGRPINDQSRASAWHILRWLELLRVDHVLIENVPEFQSWGPIGAHGRPLKAKKGETFRAFVAAIESYGYRVEWRVLNAADYGAATTRRRLFIRASRKAIVWPEPTHSRTGSATLFGDRRRWRAAREVIDWSLPSRSIFERKKPLKPATMRRIYEGLRRFGGDEVRPFLVQLTHGGRLYDVETPLPTVTTANRGETGLVQPFVLGQHGGSVARPVSEPVPTIATDGALCLIEPYLTEYYGNGGAQSVDDPLPTVTTRDRFALVQPVVNGQALDIRFRMLQPHELAAAMSFPPCYRFTGNKGETIKQIGNAVVCAVAEALCGAIFDSARPRAARVEQIA